MILVIFRELPTLPRSFRLVPRLPPRASGCSRARWLPLARKCASEEVHVLSYVVERYDSQSTSRPKLLSDYVIMASDHDDDELHLLPSIASLEQDPFSVSCRTCLF